MTRVKRAAGAAGTLLLVAVGGMAFACANLATLSLSTSEAAPGATVTVNGSSFSYPQAGGQAPTPVVIHWRNESGPVLAQTVPDRFGTISTSFTVPAAAPGDYAIVATQVTARRSADAPADAPPVQVAELGTPARAQFKVLAGGGAVSALRSPTVDELGDSSTELDSSIWVAMIATLGAVAVLLLGSGLVAFLYQSRQAKLPAEARWVPPGW
jgi:hypothetical protein